MACNLLRRIETTRKVGHKLRSDLWRDLGELRCDERLGKLDALVGAKDLHSGIAELPRGLVHINACATPHLHLLHNLAARPLDPANVLHVDTEIALCARENALRRLTGLIQDLHDLGDDEAVRELLLLLRAPHLRCAVAHVPRGLVNVHLCAAAALDLPDHGTLPALQPAHAGDGYPHDVVLPTVQGVGWCLQGASCSAGRGAAGGSTCQEAQHPGQPRGLRRTAARCSNQRGHNSQGVLRQARVDGGLRTWQLLRICWSVPFHDPSELALKDLPGRLHSLVGAVEYRAAVAQLLRALVHSDEGTRARFNVLDLRPAGTLDPAHILLRDLHLVEAGGGLERGLRRVLQDDAVPLLRAYHLRLEGSLALAHGVRIARDVSRTVAQLPRVLVDPDAGASPGLQVADLRAVRAFDPPHVLLWDMHLGCLARGCQCVGHWICEPIPLHHALQLASDDVVGSLHGIIAASKHNTAVAELLRGLVNAHLRPTPYLDLPNLRTTPALQPANKLLRDPDLASACRRIPIQTWALGQWLVLEDAEVLNLKGLQVTGAQEPHRQRRTCTGAGLSHDF
mmetsp:Transcript_61638/g.198544  ORF Transcript_61638/g.198544 Transcript_61638/m.198544 type:complete len:567 (+) Transcript_61638:810-2510(+)